MTWRENDGIIFKFSSAHDHRQNGKTERFHKYLVEQILVLMECKGKGLVKNMWTRYLGVIVLRYNHGKLSRWAATPYEIVFGSHAVGVQRADEVDHSF